MASYTNLIASFLKKKLPFRMQERFVPMENENEGHLQEKGFVM